MKHHHPLLVLVFIIGGIREEHISYIEFHPLQANHTYFNPIHDSCTIKHVIPTFIPDMTTNHFPTDFKASQIASPPHSCKECKHNAKTQSLFCRLDGSQHQII